MKNSLLRFVIPVFAAAIVAAGLTAAVALATSASPHTYQGAVNCASFGAVGEFSTDFADGTYGSPDAFQLTVAIHDGSFDLGANAPFFAVIVPSNDGSTAWFFPDGTVSEKGFMALHPTHPEHILVCLHAVHNTAVNLIRFSAHRLGKAISLNWNVGAEYGTAGYNVLRGDGSRVNAKLIPAGRTSYTLIDSRRPDKYFGYRLVEVTNRGAHHVLGWTWLSAS